MNEDPLESELEAIRPRPLSRDFMPRLEDRLSTGPSARRLNRILKAGLAAAASIAFVAVALHRVHAPRPSQPQLVRSSPAELATPEPLQTIAQYQHAYQQSSEAFETLLQQRPVGATQRPVDHSYDVVRYDLN